MVIGIGTDLCDIRRIEKTLNRFGEKFVYRIYSDYEREKAKKNVSPASVYAKNFAAKEALSKALGTGFRFGVFWKNIEIRNHKSGKPYVVLSGGALLRLEDITPEGQNAIINLSLSDEYPLAHAMVTISTVCLENNL